MSHSFPAHAQAHLFASSIESVSLLGTVHHRRWRWNPFDSLNDMTWIPDQCVWRSEVALSSRGGRHGDGQYSFRLVLNHNSHRPVKALAVTQGGWDCTIDAEGTRSDNFTLAVSNSGPVWIIFDPLRMRLNLESGSTGVTPVMVIGSLELNGFPWDGSSIFEKFNERGEDRQFRATEPDCWTIDVPLTTKGGIDFRQDGVYQFLISCNGDEDQGFGAMNPIVPVSTRLELVKGTGFGSSQGTAMHSAPTVRVTEDGLFTLKVEHNPSAGWSVEIIPLQGGAATFINRCDSIQVLGTIFADRSFDPTEHERWMRPTSNPDILELAVFMSSGIHAINFGIGAELFLDTMGLGCWLDPISGWSSELRGVGWHGKPSESNICFEVSEDCEAVIHYDRGSDVFSITSVSRQVVFRPCLGVHEMSLVGSFDSPLVAWQTAAPENLMTRLALDRYEKFVELKQDVVYEYKYVANRSPWLLVFADYELDGYGMSYTPTPNPSVFDCRLEDLKRYGHLTSHGNPPAITYRATFNGLHRFIVDLATGAHGITHVSGSSL